MNKELIQDIKGFNFLEKLKINYYIDAVDEGRWKVGKVVGFKTLGHRHTITVRFDGHTSRWNEDYDLPSSHKLAPFRRFSLPYTGPWMSGRQIHRDTPSLNFQEPLRELNQISYIDKLKPEFINQVYRGDLFILLDNILTKKTLLNKEEFNNVKAFIGTYIQTGLKIIDYSLDKIPEISALNILDPNAIYVSTPFAMINSLTQFLFNFNSLINPSENRVKFFEANEINGGKELRKEIKSFLIESKVDEKCKMIMDYQNPPHRGFAWNIKKEALILLGNFESKMEFPKIHDVREITDLMDYLNYLNTKSGFSSDVIEKKQIELIIRLIISGNFEGKLKGMNEMKKIVDNAREKQKMVKEQIRESNLLTILTDNSCFNGELFKRSLPIFEFAEKNELMTPEILTRILNLHKDKHELQLKSVYTTLSEFGKILNDKEVLAFFDAIRTFPIEEHWVNLIKDYTLIVANQHPIYRKKYSDASTGLGVACFWEIIEGKRKQKVSEQLMDKIILNFSEILVNDFYKKETDKYISAAIYGIKERKNMDSYFQIIQHSLKKNREFAVMIDRIDREINIVDTVVNSVVSEKISNKGLENMFEFLEEVNHHARKKMSVTHIKMLWNLPGCKNSLLKFMRKYRNPRASQQKSTDKILFKLLSKEEIRQIIDHIFLNQELMQGYLEISQQTYQTADELIVCSNAHKKSIDYNYKHTIICEKANQLMGLNFYMNVIENCENQEMIDKCLKRLIQFYLRPAAYKRAEKLKIWMICIEEISKLNKGKYRGYEMFLEEMKGRMESLTILETTLTHLSVMNKGTKERKIISLPRNSSLWNLRQVINQEFNMKSTNFEMFYPGRNNAFEMEKEEDFSLAYIETPKDPSIPSVMITPTSELHPHFVNSEQFKKMFSIQYAESLYKKIPKKSKNTQKIILNILNQVPPIKALEKKMNSLDSSTPWEQLLDEENKIKLSYQLSIISKVKGQGIQWAQAFIKKKGIEYLQKLFMTRSYDKFQAFDYTVFTELVGLLNEMLKFFKLKDKILPFSENFVLELIKLPKSYDQPEVLEYLYTAFGVLRQIVTYEHMNLKLIIESSVVKELLEVLLFRNSCSPIANRLPETLSLVCEKGKCVDLLEKYMRNWMKFSWLKKNRNSLRLYFNLLVYMFEKNQVRSELLESTREFITAMREDKEMMEEDEKTCDSLIFGWLKVTECLTRINKTSNSLKIFHESEENFALYLINDGLFNKIHRLQSSESRLMAYQILTNLKCEKQIIDLIGEITRPLMQKGSWRKQFEWFVKSFRKRSPDSSVGIKNLAATCYINSLLQQLFHIKQFREPLLSINTKSIEDEENVAYQIQKIFAHLKYSDNDVYTTESLCRTFILDGQPIDPRIQTDVDEFFHSLMDKLERNFMKIEKKHIIDDIFRGEYSNLIIGQECPHRSERIEHFMSMRLEILNKKSLQQALEEFIKGEILEGDNAYFCEKCDKKVKALKKVCVKTLPDILILTLKRFQFDFDKMEKFKLNTFCEFPQELNMFPFTKEALENQEKFSTKNFEYRLKGVVIHYGISEAGHYTSYVRTSENEWKYFDDDRIYPFDVSQLGKECFGGVEQNFYSENTEKIKNAYLLIYERVTMKEGSKIKVDASIKAEVEEENERNQEVKVLFEDGLRNFMDNNYLTMGRSYLIYVHLILLRSESRSRNIKLAYENCIKLFQGKPVLAEWYLSQFSQNFIRELLIYSYFQVSHFVASLVCYCLKNTINLDFIRRCMKCIEVTNMVPLSKVFQSAVRSNVQYMKSLAEYSFGEKVMKIIKDRAVSSNAYSKIQNVRSEFGEGDSKFVERKDYRDPVQLIQAIEGFKLPLTQQEIQILSIRAKKLSSQISLAKIVVNRKKDEESFVKFLEQFIALKLMKEEPKLDLEYTFRFSLILISAFAEIKDELQIKRIKILVKAYFNAILISLEGYKAMRLLLEGLFNICFTNEVFWTEFLLLLNSSANNKKMAKAIRQWIKEGDKLYFHVKNEKMGYWRKPDPKYYVPRSCLDQIEADGKIKVEKYLSLFNSLVEKHKIDFQSQWDPDVKIGETVILSNYEETEAKVIGKVGLLLEIEENKFTIEDDVTVVRAFE